MANDEPSSAESNDREERLLAIVRSYTAAVEAGQKPDRRAIMRRHPDLADDLSACLGGLTFLNNAAGQLAATAQDLVDPTLGGPQTLGDYRLLREIGRGGMGVVYEAEQMSLGRRVAVKVLPMAAALDKRQLQRFKNEAQAAAQLHHTHIVPVYAVGVERSTHYYAMQLIDGQSLADVIADLRIAAEQAPSTFSLSNVSSIANSQPSLGLSSLRVAKRQTFYQNVARLGLQAAEALHHAHHAGIVHRDIKPANLLLDNEAGLWITDFGLAQFYAAENNLTQSSDRPGTLRYMSPEQASGKAVVLDQRTDVYSLGVTLYELLTLERAVPGDTREQLLRHLENEDLRPARSVDPAIPKELDTILSTACAKDAADRYITAGALAEDLRRFLADQPILAKPPPVTQRLSRWVRRHRALTWSTIITGLFLLAGFAVATVLIASEQANTQAALVREKARHAEADAERQRAQRSFAEARDAVDYFARVAATELSDDRPAPEVRREMLEAALDYYEAFLNDRRNDPTQARELEDAQKQVSEILTELSAIEEAYNMRTLVGLLADSAVQQELGLLPVQAARAVTLSENLSTGRFGNEPLGDPVGRGGPQSSWQRERLIRLGSQIKTTLNGLLTGDQFNRLRQIARQARGPATFGDPDVVKSLGLTLEQKDQARVILATVRAANRRPGMAQPSEESDAFNRFDPDLQTPRQRALASLTGLLKPSQLAAWNKLIGRPFPNVDRLDPDYLRGRGPRGGRGGRGDFEGRENFDRGFGPGGRP